MGILIAAIVIGILIIFAGAVLIDLGVNLGDWIQLILNNGLYILAAIVTIYLIYLFGYLFIMSCIAFFIPSKEPKPKVKAERRMLNVLIRQAEEQAYIEARERDTNNKH